MSWLSVFGARDQRRPGPEPVENAVNTNQSLLGCKFSNRLKILQLILAASLGFAPKTWSFTAIVAFGDSYTDTGRAPSSPPNYWNGRFSNGPLWIEYLAQQLGFSYNASDNYAVSGTESNELGIEINNFPGTSDSANVLFAIWSGNNDFGNHLNIGYNDSGWDNQMNSVVYSLTTASDLLYQKGARQIVLFNQIDLTRVPYILNSYSATFRSYIAGKIQIFNSRLSQAIPGLLSSHPGLTVYLYNIHSDFDYLLNSYGTLGFTQETMGAINNPNLSDNSFSGPGANYVFWDSEHPTTKAHALISRWLANLLPAPPPPAPPPSITITGPANGSTFVAPASFSITAGVVSNGWTISQVNLLENDTAVSQVSAPPYSVSLASLPVGTYTFSASVTYASTSVVTANPVQVTVSAPAGGALPAPWTNLDIGPVGQAGSANYNSNGTFVVSGSGNDISGMGDTFQFTCQPIVGNATMTARITSLEDTDGFAKAGLMFRQSFTSNSVNVMVFITPASGDGFQNRTVTGGTSNYIQSQAVTAPYWLRLQRTNDNFSGYGSPDGTNWTLLGSMTNAMGSAIYGGVAVTAHNNTLVSTATIDSLQVIHQVPLVSPRISIARWPTNSMQLNATGSIGATFVCEVSTNLTSWSPFSTNLNTSGTLQISLPTNAVRQGFFRIQLQR